MDRPRERFGLGVSNCRSASDVVESVVVAEACGAEVAFIAEDINCRDAFQLAALASNRTRSIRLSTGVANPYTRNPTALAMAVATLDEISGGRAGLGLGSSSRALIEGQMGIPHSGSIDQMREATEIIRHLLDGESVTYEGARFRYTASELEVKPVQRHVPIVFAAMGPAMLALAGQLADGVLLNVGAAPAYVRWAVGRVREGARQAGRDPGQLTIAAWLSTYVTDDFERGLQKAREWLATMLSIPRQGELLLEGAGFDTSILADIRRHVTGYPHTGDPTAAAVHVPREVVEELALIGDRNRVLERIAVYREAGVELPVLPISAIRSLFGSEMT